MSSGQRTVPNIDKYIEGSVKFTIGNVSAKSRATGQLQSYELTGEIPILGHFPVLTEAQMVAAEKKFETMILETPELDPLASKLISYIRGQTVVRSIVRTNPNLIHANDDIFFACNLQGTAMFLNDDKMDEPDTEELKLFYSNVGTTKFLNLGIKMVNDTIDGKVDTIDDVPMIDCLHNEMKEMFHVTIIAVKHFVEGIRKEVAPPAPGATEDDLYDAEVKADEETRAEAKRRYSPVLKQLHEENEIITLKLQEDLSLRSLDSLLFFRRSEFRGYVTIEAILLFNEIELSNEVRNSAEFRILKELAQSILVLQNELVSFKRDQFKVDKTSSNYIFRLIGLNKESRLALGPGNNKEGEEETTMEEIQYAWQSTLQKLHNLYRDYELFTTKLRNVKQKHRDEWAELIQVQHDMLNGNMLWCFENENPRYGGHAKLISS